MRWRIGVLRPILREAGPSQELAVEVVFGTQLIAMLLQLDATRQSLEVLTSGVE